MCNTIQGYNIANSDCFVGLRATNIDKPVFYYQNNNTTTQIVMNVTMQHN